MNARERLEKAADKARQLYDGRWRWDDDAEGFFAELERRAKDIEHDVAAALAELDPQGSWIVEGRDSKSAEWVEWRRFASHHDAMESSIRTCPLTWWRIVSDPGEYS